MFISFSDSSFLLLYLVRTQWNVVVPAGCFWCVEAVYQRVVGVSSVESGYMGGIVNNPSYGQVRGTPTKNNREHTSIQSIPGTWYAFLYRRTRLYVPRMTLPFWNNVFALFST